MTRDDAFSLGWVGPWLFDKLGEVSARLVALVKAAIERILGTESERHTKKWREAIKSATGIDVEAIVQQDDILPLLALAVARSSALVVDLNRQVAADVERVVYDAVAKQKAVSALKKELTDRFGVAEKRAELIAVDQVSTMVAELTEMRHRQAGITEYIWTTRRDERVRPLHARLHGKRYRYGQRTGAEGGLPPGMPIRCRCNARGVVRLR